MSTKNFVLTITNCHYCEPIEVSDINMSFFMIVKTQAYDDPVNAERDFFIHVKMLKKFALFFTLNEILWFSITPYDLRIQIVG